MKPALENYRRFLELSHFFTCDGAVEIGIGTIRIPVDYLVEILTGLLGVMQAQVSQTAVEPRPREAGA